MEEEHAMADTYILENTALKAVISAAGAQMVSLRDVRTDEAILWEGDPAYWRESAPWLFPVIGQLREGRFLYDGKAWETPMHGFAKRMTFEAVREGEDSVLFTLHDSEDTLKMYPWRFEFSVRYTLSGRKLTAQCRVTNRDDRVMYYSLGAHPGFVCRRGDRLNFGADELTYRRLYAENHLMKKEKERLSLENGRLTLESALFQNDALLIEEPAMTEITLEKQEGANVLFRYDSVPWLGVWTRHIPSGEVKYICLEPWRGVDDVCDADGLIEHKVGINALAPGETETFGIAIEVM